jgi:hypothetical protein
MVSLAKQAINSPFTAGQYYQFHNFTHGSCGLSQVPLYSAALIPVMQHPLNSVCITDYRWCIECTIIHV